MIKSICIVEFSCNSTTIEPENCEAASKEEVWVKAMQEEIKMIKRNKSWVLVVDLPQDKDVNGV